MIERNIDKSEWKQHRVTYFLENSYRFQGIKKPPSFLTIGCYGKQFVQGGAGVQGFEEMSEMMDELVYGNLIGRKINIEKLEEGELIWMGTYNIVRFMCDHGFFPLSFKFPLGLFRAHAEGKYSSPLSII